MRLLKELRAGLPAIAAAGELRMMRAEVGAIDVRALLCQQLDQASLYALVVFDRIEPACDTRLIRDDDDEEAMLVELFDRLSGAREEFDLAGLVQESRVIDDGAIAIEKDRSASHEVPRLPCPPVQGKWCGRRVTCDCRRRAR